MVDDDQRNLVPVAVAKALERVGADVTVSAEVEPEADALVVPGQGAFGSCVVNLGARWLPK